MDETKKADNRLTFWILGFFGSLMIVVLSAVISSNTAYKAGIDARVNNLEVQIGINSTNSTEIQRRLVRIEDKIDILEKSFGSGVWSNGNGNHKR